jgi:hypothetical protein
LIYMQMYTHRSVGRIMTDSVEACKITESLSKTVQ